LKGDLWESFISVVGDALTAIAGPALAQDITFTPIIEARLRYETVDQEGPAPLASSRNADAVTICLASTFKRPSQRWTSSMARPTSS
jgi:hypothetical protein